MTILADFHFLRPYWLLLLLPYMAIMILMWRNKLSHGNWSLVCDAALLPYLLQKDALHQSRWPLFSGGLAAILVILALAGPTWDRLPSPAFRNDAALVVILDLSRSMDANDIKPSRLTMARFRIADILKQRKDGQSALIVYAGDAFVVTPLTNDTETIISQLPALTTDIMPSEGSNTSIALEKSIALFKQAGLQKGQILLVTDGVDVDATLPVVNNLEPYRLSVLGVGTAEGAPIALPEGGFLKNRQGAIVVPKLQRSDLEKIAQAGHGSYQMLNAKDEDIRGLLSTLDETAQQKTGQVSQLAVEIWNDRGPWLLLLALPLVAVSFRKGVICLVLLILPLPKTSYALTWQDLWLTQDQQGAKAYQSQHFAQAATKFENPAWKMSSYFKAGNYDKAVNMLKHSQTSDDFYNKANALAQSGKLSEAIKAYQKALALDPNNADAKYNKAIVAKELEKQQEQARQQAQQDQQNNPQDSQQKNNQEQNSQQNQQNQQNQEGSSSGDIQKPEQKPEKSQENSANQQQTDDASQTAQTNKVKDKQQTDADQAAKEAAQLMEQKKSESNATEPHKAVQTTVVEEQPYDEKQQANEQWLKRIPDDPAGLLKRKFKYQYGKRDHTADDSAYAW